jgi:hypothetical protein
MRYDTVPHGSAVMSLVGSMFGLGTNFCRVPLEKEGLFLSEVPIIIQHRSATSISQSTPAAIHNTERCLFS